MNKPIQINSYLYFLIYAYINFYFYLFLVFFFAGPSSAYVGWAKPNQSGPVTGLSQ